MAQTVLTIGESRRCSLHQIALFRKINGLLNHQHAHFILPPGFLQHGCPDAFPAQRPLHQQFQHNVGTLLIDHQTLIVLIFQELAKCQILLPAAGQGLHRQNLKDFLIIIQAVESGPDGHRFQGIAPLQNLCPQHFPAFSLIAGGFHQFCQIQRLILQSFHGTAGCLKKVRPILSGKGKLQAIHIAIVPFQLHLGTGGLLKFRRCQLQHPGFRIILAQQRQILQLDTRIFQHRRLRSHIHFHHALGRFFRGI